MESMYRFMEGLGYDHPLHPAFTHMPIGLEIGAFIFLVVALIFRRNSMKTTAHQCVVLAFIFAFPTIFFGVADWLEYYHGEWLYEIKIKIALTVALMVFLAAGIILCMRSRVNFTAVFIAYALGAASLAAIGYYGAQISFGGEAASVKGMPQQGKKLYAANCGSCHPEGRNVINPALPVVNAPELKDEKTFIGYIRNPVRPGGAPGTMPAFDRERLSDRDLAQIYHYINSLPTASPRNSSSASSSPATSAKVTLSSLRRRASPCFFPRSEGPVPASSFSSERAGGKENQLHGLPFPSPSADSKIRFFVRKNLRIGNITSVNISVILTLNPQVLPSFRTGAGPSTEKKRRPCAG